MKINNKVDHGETTSSILARKGEITADRMEREAIWQREGRKLYITCRSCSAINDISGHHVRFGFVSPCFVCTNCRAHYYARLDDWDEPATVRCDSCKKCTKDTPKGLKESGWASNEQTCECCVRHWCPECKGKENERRKSE